MATLAKQVADLRADVDALKGAAAAPAPAVEDGAEEDKTDDDEKGGEAPADAGEAPADDPPAQPGTPPPPGDDDADGDGEEDKDEEETTARKAAAALGRAVKLANDLFGKLEAALAENARLKAALADPAYARAAMRPTDVPAQGDAAAPKKNAAARRRELEAEYDKIESPRERNAFRKAHAKELGLA